jgi:hypothetical protein
VEDFLDGVGGHCRFAAAIYGGDEIDRLLGPIRAKRKQQPHEPASGR